MQGSAVRVYRAEGYGFINTASGREMVFFHRADLVPPLSMQDETLIGSRVEFDAIRADRGTKLRAKRVRPIGATTTLRRVKT